MKPTRRVHNIEVSIFGRLPVIFTVGMETTYSESSGLFCGCGLLQRLLMLTVNTVAYNVESSDLAVRVSILAD